MLTLSDPTDCSLPGFSVHGIFQARVLEWVAIAFSTVSAYCTKFKEVPTLMFMSCTYTNLEVNLSLYFAC